MKKLIFGFLFCFSGIILYSHPHIYIKPTIDLRVVGNRVTGIVVTWEWDRWWSDEVIVNCDANRNGRFETVEAEKVYSGYFIGVQDFNFFTEIKANNRRLNFSGVTDFVPTMSNRIVTYRFVIPVEIPLNTAQNIRIVFNDETIFVAFEQIAIAGNARVLYSNKSVETVGYYGTALNTGVSLR